MKLAFSTLGCPHWELERIAEAARAYGYRAVELRAIGGDLDLLKRPELQKETAGTSRIRWPPEIPLKTQRAQLVPISRTSICATHARSRVVSTGCLCWLVAAQSPLPTR